MLVSIAMRRSHFAKPRLCPLASLRAARHYTAAGSNGNASSDRNATAATPAEGPYHFPAKDVLNAMKAGDFGKVQNHATDLVQHKWKEEYSVPTACAVIFLVLWYWVAWSRRSIRRQCRQLEAAMELEASETVELVRSLTQKWRRDISKSNDQMQGIIDKNSALTGDIDRLTTALRSCTIHPTPNIPSLSVNSANNSLQGE